MASFRFAVGNEQEDGLFLLNGFSVPCERSGRMCRSCAMVFEMRLPMCSKGALEVTLSMLVTDPDLETRFFAGEKEVHAARSTTQEWGEHSFVVPEDAPREGGCISLRGEMNADPAFPPARVVAISEVRLSSVDSAEIELPPNMAADKICQYPIKITSMYRSYHEGHKMRPLFGDRLWNFQYSSEKKIFFGDVHVHTDYSRCGHGQNKSLEENVRIAKQRGHDFVALTDHAEHMDEENWKRYFEEIREAGRRHDILTIPAVEWTSYEHGHRNIYFLNESTPPYFSSYTFETDHPAKLGAFFDKHGIDAFAAPHHTAYISHLTDFNSVSEDVEVLIEMYSTWGSSEKHGAALQDTHNTMPGGYVQDALCRGLKLGFVAGGDAHNTLAGDSGLTGVIADELTLESIYKAMAQRLCYATAGDKIFLDFHINGFPMGSVLRVNQYSVNKLFPIHIALSAVCPTPFKRVEVICNGEVIYSHTQRDRKSEVDLHLCFEKSATPARIEAGRETHLVNLSRYYYVRVVQHDGGIAWSSPIWIDYVHNWR